MSVVNIAGKKYSFDDLPNDIQHYVISSLKVEKSIESLVNQHTILTRAKNEYLNELKLEIVQKKSGIDFQSLIFDAYEG